MSEIHKADVITTTRPDCVEDEHLTCLDVLRETGAINMFGAAPHIVGAYGLSNTEARQILKYWMETFGNENR